MVGQMVGQEIESEAGWVVQSMKMSGEGGGGRGGSNLHH